MTILEMAIIYVSEGGCRAATAGLELSRRSLFPATPRKDHVIIQAQELHPWSTAVTEPFLDWVDLGPKS